MSDPAPSFEAEWAMLREDYLTVRLYMDAISGRCSHLNAIPVELVVTGEVVARLCPGRDEQLPR